MVSLVERVHRTITRHGLLPPDARVLVAASAGADSTALLHLLHELAPVLRVALAGVAHFNHRLRPDAGADEAFCRGLASSLSLPFEAGGGDVAAEAARTKSSLEDAGRRMRYAFLEQAAAKLGASHVAVGHTRDDQAETVLLALIRGAGPRGLAGIAPRRGIIVRPLIERSHAELLEWLSARALAFREDESNQDTRFLRNRVRHELLPLLHCRFSPGVVSVLARAATIAADDAAFLDGRAAQLFSEVVLPAAGGRCLVLDAGRLASADPAIARRVAALALSRFGRAGAGVGFGQAERLVTLARGDLRGPVSFPGQQAEIIGGRVRLTPREGRSAGKSGPRLNSFRATLSIPGEALVPDGRVVSSELRRRGGTEALGGRGMAVIDAAAVSSLSVRFRQPGDLFRPLGLGGRKKLQDYFVDRKVPRDRRDATPLVVDAHDRIVWVAGHVIAEDFRVGLGTRDVVILKLRGEGF
jgi:tRNA(Ile)-lysidine synthase